MYLAQLSTFVLEPGILLTIALTVIGGIIWAVRVEGRVTAHDESFAALDKLLEERDEHIKDRHNEVAARLTRIETKIDAGFKNGKSV